MIGLTQLLQYIVVVKDWGKPCDQVIKNFKGATGHSQVHTNLSYLMLKGILAAVTVASSSTMEELIENTFKTLSFLFWLGVRLQESVPFPPFVSRNDILQESRLVW
jgi:hypothetical protein